MPSCCPLLFSSERLLEITHGRRLRWSRGGLEAEHGRNCPAMLIGVVVLDEVVGRRRMEAADLAARKLTNCARLAAKRNRLAITAHPDP
eukprot:9475487-Pyramimonas_sp.AAC.3